MAVYLWMYISLFVSPISILHSNELQYGLLLGDKLKASILLFYSICLMVRRCSTCESICHCFLPFGMLLTNSMPLLLV